MNSQMHRNEQHIKVENVNFPCPALQARVAGLDQFRVEKRAEHVHFGQCLFATPLRNHVEVKVDHLWVLFRKTIEFELKLVEHTT